MAGQLLLREPDLVEQARRAIDQLIDVMGRAAIEAVVQKSAAQFAGLESRASENRRPRHPDRTCR